MTDNEIIKAYGCCSLGDFGGCKECPCEVKNKCIVVHEEYDLEREVFNLLNRQKAEIERLRAEYGKQSALWSKHYESLFETTKETIRAEALKELVERLEKASYITEYIPSSTGDTIKIRHITMNQVRSIMKEMVGDSDV